MLKLAEAFSGQVILLDDGFTCHVSGVTFLNGDEDGRLYFECDEGRHYIDGQADDGINCIGIYPHE